MATITFTIVSQAAGTLSKTYTFAEADMERFFRSLGFPGQTRASVAQGWANKIINNTVATVRDYEQRQPPADLVVT